MPRLLFGLGMGCSLGLAVGMVLAFLDELHNHGSYSGGAIQPSFYRFVPASIAIGGLAGMICGVAWNRTLHRVFSVVVMSLGCCAVTLSILAIVGGRRTEPFDHLESEELTLYALACAALLGGLYGARGNRKRRKREATNRARSSQ